MSPNKTCTNCRQTQPIDAFSPLPIARDGLNSWCRRCVALSGKQRYRRLMRRHDIPIPETKRCRSCGVVKPAAEFNAERGRLDGLEPRCKVCRKAQRHKRYLVAVERQKEKAPTDEAGAKLSDVKVGLLDISPRQKEVNVS